MKRIISMWLVLMAVALTSCDYTEVKREVGYKGKARINPWLAAERFAGRMGRSTRSVISWTAPDWEEAVWLMPAEVLSNESFTRRMENWVHQGGHLILLVENAAAETNDWSKYHATPEFHPALFSMLERASIKLEETGGGGEKPVVSEIDFKKQSFEVEAGSNSTVSHRGKKPGIFASTKSGKGRLTVVTDGRLFRNRWIGEHEHAALLDALIESTGNEGTVGFMRGSGLSLWAMLRQHLWQVVLGLGVWILLWLWKSFNRFGPVESAVPAQELRGYEHHLEALGDFQWRLDRAASMLVPLREQVVELGQRTSMRTGRRDDDFFQFLADRAGIPRERVFRALAESAPPDAAVLTRTAADLQQLLKVLHNPVLP